mgnify:CR=1 FL=1
MKIKLTKITTQDKDKTGKPYVGKNGPYTRMGIQCQEYGQKWLSGFLNAYNARWKEGDVVEVVVEPVFREGKEYLNFRGLSRIDLLEMRIQRLEEFIKNGNNGNSTTNDGQSEQGEPEFPDFTG